MKTFLRNLSPAAEFCIVILLCFGLMLIASFTDAYLHLIAGPLPRRMTDARYLGMVAQEVAALAVVNWMGRARGWSLADFGWKISWKGVGAALLLLIGSEFALWCQAVAFHLFQLPIGYGRTFTGGLGIATIILLSVINPIFEEVMEVGYFVRTLEKRGMWPAVLASTLLRTSLHVYGGLYLIATTIVLGLIFSMVYWRWRQLWPLIFVHAIFDFFGLMRYLHAG